MRPRSVSLCLASLLLCLTGCIESPPELGDDAPDAGAIDPPDGGDVPVALPLLITPINPVGNLSLVSRAEDAASTNTGGASVWRAIPAFSAVAWTAAGDHLEVEVTANLAASGNVWLRALVDGVVANPSDVLFRSGGSNGARSFRFVASGLTAGSHVVEVQWLGDPAARIVDHNLTVHAASPTQGLGRLVVVAAPSGAELVRTSTAWADIPGTSATVFTEGSRDLVMTFSAESRVTSGSMLVRPVVDGVARNDVQFQSSGGNGAWDARSSVFVVSGLGAGTHSVRMQWAAGPSSTAYLGDRTVTAFTSGFSHLGGGVSAVATEPGTTSLTSSEFTTIATQSFGSWDPSSIAAVTFSAEITSTGRLLLQADVDGRIANPGEVVMVDAASGRGMHTYTFHIKNRAIGLHEVRIRARVVSGTATIRDRALAINFNRRHGSDFAQPTEGMAPRAGEFKHLVICFDPKRTDRAGKLAARPFTFWELYAIFIGDDGRKNVTDWFAEQSFGKYRAGRHWFLPCHTSTQPNNWYHDNLQFDRMHEDAILASDVDIDFRQFDTNGDRQLTTDEILVTIVKPQATTDGNWGGAWAHVTVDGVAMDIPYIDAYMVPPGVTTDDFRNRNVGLGAHEMAHALLGAQELSVTNAVDPYTIMDNYTLASHLDPVHKLLSGWSVPDVIETTTLGTHTVTMRAIEVGGESLVVYDPARETEMFIIEHRWPDSSNYDGFETTALGIGGVAVWRVELDPSTRAWEPTGRPRVGAVALDVTGESLLVMWADGTPAFRVTARGNAPAPELTIDLTAP